MEMFSVVGADGQLAAGMVLGPLVEAAAVVVAALADWVLVATMADWELVVVVTLPLPESVVKGPLLEAGFGIFEAMLLLQGIIGGLLLATFGGPLALLLVMMGV